MKYTIIIVILLVIAFSCAPCLTTTELVIGKKLDVAEIINPILSWLQTGLVVTVENLEITETPLLPEPTYTHLPTYTPYPTYTYPPDTDELSSPEAMDDNKIEKATLTKTKTKPPATTCPQIYINTPCP